MSKETLTAQINKLIPPDRAAEILGVTKETLCVWRCVGRVALPFVKVGRKVMYRHEDIEAFIENRTYKQTA